MLTDIQWERPTTIRDLAAADRGLSVVEDDAGRVDDHAAGLCALLPLAPGDRVGIWGPAVHASDAVTAAGALPIVLEPADPGAVARAGGCAGCASGRRRLALGDAVLDHFLVPAHAAGDEGWLSAEAARVVRPAGWLVVAMRGHAGRSRRVWPWHHGPDGRRADCDGGACACSAWHASGFRITARYGYARDVHGRWSLVSIDRPDAVTYYLQALRAEAPRWRWLHARLAAALVNAGRPDRLFDTVVVVGQRCAE